MSTFLSGLDFFVNQVRALPPEILVTVNNPQQLTEVEKQRHREFATIAWTHPPLSPFHLFGALADLSVKNDEYTEALAYLHTIDGSFPQVRDDQTSFAILTHVIETKENLLKHEQMLMVAEKIHKIPSVYDLHTFLEHASTLFQMEQYMGRRLFPQDAREIAQVADALAEATACGTEQVKKALSRAAKFPWSLPGAFFKFWKSRIDAVY